jgi:hypothetical protein
LVGNGNDLTVTSSGNNAHLWHLHSSGTVHLLVKFTEFEATWSW